MRIYHLGLFTLSLLSVSTALSTRRISCPLDGEEDPTGTMLNFAIWTEDTLSCHYLSPDGSISQTCIYNSQSGLLESEQIHRDTSARGRIPRLRPVFDCWESAIIHSRNNDNDNTNFGFEDHIFDRYMQAEPVEGFQWGEKPHMSEQTSRCARKHRNPGKLYRA